MGGAEQQVALLGEDEAAGVAVKNSDTDNSCSNALTWRENGRLGQSKPPACSPACVKLPASAAA